MHFYTAVLALALAPSLCSPVPDALSAPAPAPAPACNTACEVDKWSFTASNADFNAERLRKIAQPTDAAWNGVDWLRASDGCSVPEWLWGAVRALGGGDKDHPRGYDFVKGCYRHDFAYLNFQRGGRFTRANRLKIDEKFKADLLEVCARETDDVGEKDGAKKAECDFFANAYFQAVRFGGGGQEID